MLIAGDHEATWGGFQQLLFQNVLGCIHADQLGTSDVTLVFPIQPVSFKCLHYRDLYKYKVTILLL